jgi:hypothetical protein
MTCLVVKAFFFLVLLTNIYASIQLPVVLQKICKWSSTRKFAVLPFLHLDRCEDIKKGLETNQARLVTQDLNLKEAMLRQYEQELMTQGERVTIMCVGESGVGKTSLISNILTVPLARAAAPPTKEISDTLIDVDDGGVRLSVTFVDTPGYGDVLEIGQTFRLIAADLDQRMKNAVLVEAKSTDRPGFLSRAKNLGVDVVLYFIAPHRLKGIDIEFMKMIQVFLCVLYYIIGRMCRGDASIIHYYFYDAGPSKHNSDPCQGRHNDSSRTRSIPRACGKTPR